jgi:hypothetical protein
MKVIVDTENASEEWWDSARATVAASGELMPKTVLALVPLMDGEVDSVRLTKEEGEDVAAWAARLPGWDAADAPEYARHPLIFQY